MKQHCYLLGALPKNTEYKPTSPYLKEDLKKLDEFSKQVRYMSRYGIETFDDLYADREKLQRLPIAPSCKTKSAERHQPKRKTSGRKSQALRRR